MELIIFIVVISYIVKAIKKSNEEMAKSTQKNQQQTYQMPKQATRVNSPKVQVQQQREQFKQMTLEGVEKARQYATNKLQEFEKDVLEELHGNPSKPQQNRAAMQQVQEGRAEARRTTIVERAKANTDATKTDVTLESMEAEHNHSERVSAAVHNHSEDILSDNMLGTVEDLMVKGYDGNLCFERDFVGEGLDMISRFSYQ